MAMSISISEEERRDAAAVARRAVPCEEGGGVRGPEGGRRGRARVALCRRAADVAAPGSAPSVAKTLPGIKDEENNPVLKITSPSK